MGKYHYKHLPMVFKTSPGIFQQKMKISLRGFEFIRAYIEIILFFTEVDWKYHIQNWKLI